MTKQHAILLTEMMPEEAAAVIRNFGKADMDEIAGATIDYLKELKLIQHAKNLLTGEFIWVLTGDGKKVQKALSGGR
jgi:hypothetical protein